MKGSFFCVLVLLAARSVFPFDITTDTLWSGDIRVTESVTVLDGATLTIEAGTTVELPADAIIRVEGRIVAEGTSDRPILFTRYDHDAGSGRWGKIRLSDADGVNRLIFCRFWYGDGMVSSHEGNEAVVSLSHSQALIEDCEFHEIHGDCVNPWNGTTLTLRRCYLCAGGEGVHGDDSDVEEDSCIFAYREGRYDASDIQGEGHTVWVHNCTFMGSNLDDGCDFDHCDGIVEHCFFYNYLGTASGWEERCGAVTMNEGSNPTIRYNVFVNCRQGIISKGESHPYITNCDFINCENDIAAYEAGESSPRQVGHPTVRNCIMWRTRGKVLVLGIDSGTGSSSTVDIDYCDVDSTPTLFCGDPRVTCGPHIFSADPMFINDADNGDFHLRAGSPCIRAGEGGVDIGAFPFASFVRAWRFY